MSAFTLSKVSAAPKRGAFGHFKRRWMHGSLKRQAIMMPAMSPLMTEGTITCWKKREGEAFAAGDVLLQIESDIAMIDVEAQAPGIMGRILIPDGTTNVAVEQVIALVAKDLAELSQLQNASTIPTPPPFNPIPATPSSTIATSPRHLEFRLPLLSPRTPSIPPRTPSLFEKQMMGYGNRSIHGGPRGSFPRLDAGMDSPAFLDMPPCASPQIQYVSEIPPTPKSAMWPGSASVPQPNAQDQVQLEGAAIRRMIVSNLASQRPDKTVEAFDEFV